LLRNLVVSRGERHGQDHYAAQRQEADDDHHV
jgi:hypothetical protein